MRIAKEDFTLIAETKKARLVEVHGVKRLWLPKSRTRIEKKGTLVIEEWLACATHLSTSSATYAYTGGADWDDIAEGYAGQGGPGGCW